MHVEVLLEEPSAEVALRYLLPKLLPLEASFKPIVFQGKTDLLNQLEARLQAYKQWMPDDFRTIVLLDEDREDCRRLKRRLEQAAARAGLRTKAYAKRGQIFDVLNRIAVEELEAWFLGDVPAIVQAFPRVSTNLAQRAKFRDPDTIAGGTWEALECVLQQYGYYRGGLSKTDAAQRIAQFMDPDRNRSRSFQAFRDGLRALVAQ